MKYLTAALLLAFIPFACFAQDSAARIARISAAGNWVHVKTDSCQACGLHRIGAHQKIVIIDLAGTKFLVGNAALMRGTVENNFGSLCLEERQRAVQ